MRTTVIMVFILALTGCSEYSSYTKCMVVEEQKGASNFTAAQYCNTLVQTNKIDCDSWGCKDN